MLEDKLPELIRSAFNVKILVSASYKAKETLAAKGLTPAVFLDRFYKDKTQKALQICYFLKQKHIRQLPDFGPIDYDEYQYIRKAEKDGYHDDIQEGRLEKKIFQQLNQEQLKFNRNVKKNVFEDKQSVQIFLNNQNFHWFDNTNKLFMYALGMSQNQFRVSTAGQPLGIVYVIEVEKGKSVKEVFDKARKQTEILFRKTYELNLNQTKNIKPIIILLSNSPQGVDEKDSLQYTAVLRNEYNIDKKYIHRISINGQDAQDSAEWGHYDRPLFYFKYTLKSSDPVRLVSNEEFQKLQMFINWHRQAIRQYLSKRIDELTKKFQEITKTSNRLMNFFKGNSGPTDKKYTNEEAEIRELGDRMFLLSDYKRSYQIYKYLAGKLEGRHVMIQTNLSEMIQYCIGMSKYHNLKLRTDPYGSIEKYSATIFDKYRQRSRLRHIRYLIFMTYIFHTFRTFNRNYIRSAFYSQIKQGFNSQILVVPLLVYEQYANMNLYYGRNSIEYRKYCYDLTRVASRFTEIKLHNYALRCFLILEDIYQETFANIEKYSAVQLGHAFIEAKNFKEALRFIKKAWMIYQGRIESHDLHKEDLEVQKLIENSSKLIQQIEKNAPEELEVLLEPNLRIPVIQSLTVQLTDQTLKHDEKSGSKWQDIGNIFMENKDLMSQGFSQKVFGNIFKSFDTGISEEKYLIHRFKADFLSEAVMKKNSRVSYVNEPIRISFYFRNPLRTEIIVENVILELKEYPGVDIAIKRAQNIIKPFQSSKFTFLVTPQVPGYLQLNKITWHFLKILAEYKIPEPQQRISQYKSCYFKVNIESAVGALESQAIFEDYYFEGERTQMKIVFKNTGVLDIDRMYIAVADSQLFGFSSKCIDYILKPGESHSFDLSIKIPAINHSIQSGEEKKLVKTLILYQTGGKFRISRTISRFNTVRVAKIDKFTCQRLSTHLHLLSFSQKKEESRRESVNLEWMVINKGYEIVKSEAAELSKETNYFFFLKKGNYNHERYSFMKNNAMSIQMYPQSLFASALSGQDQQNGIEIKFLWRKDNKFGCLEPPLIPVTINPYGCISEIFPINVKLQYPEEIEHDFSQQPYLEIPIAMKLKNIVKEEQYKITVFFFESKDPSFTSDAVWQGICQKKFRLSSIELKTDINLVVIRPGVYDISHMIHYTIENQKNKQINVNHNEYERVFITVKAKPQQLKKNNDFQVFDFFTEQEHMTQTADSTQQKQSENEDLLGI